uniref:Methyltransferase type 11 domain-containing protein n=1 Tax=Setaria viridis TaxID=4556 RepID=A0A4V6D4L2_SETVI|nr:hypothetical protein SEVIR_7G273101v2 [Setaria viridis]
MARTTRPPAACSPAPGSGTSPSSSPPTSPPTPPLGSTSAAPPSSSSAPAARASRARGRRLPRRRMLRAHGRAAAAAELSLRANGLAAAQADVRELRWGDRLEDQLRMDVVLMSDVFYDPDMPAMAATLRGLWRDGAGGGGTVGWAASEVRDSMMDCMDVLREQGFEVDEVDRVTRPLLHDPDQTAAFAVLSRLTPTTRGGVDFDYSPSC